MGRTDVIDVPERSKRKEEGRRDKPILVTDVIDVPERSKRSNSDSDRDSENE